MKGLIVPVTRKYKKGFTLIELLVVLFIIGTLTGLLLPNLMGARERARDSRRKQDLTEIKSALRLYYNDTQSYPGTVPFGTSWGIYMALVPNDSKTGQDYDYCVSDDGEGFILVANLENGGDSDIVTSASRCPTTICDPNCSGNCYFVCTNQLKILEWINEN